ncbi:MAG: carbon-nitrogen hydrolase family protein [Chloroflexota bacterium]
MARSLTVATIQLDITPEETDIRLARASEQIKQAVDTGAQLIVLPAAFNTGVTFAETTYEVTEHLTDQTHHWLHAQASEYNVRIVGSFYIVEHDDTFHRAFLVAPDGTEWHYDQQYPLLWERVFYRDGHRITVADTALGKIGFLIGWDTAHPELWESYAAKVDMLVVLHHALDISALQLHLADAVLKADELGRLGRWFVDSTNYQLRYDVREQAKWLGVPVICAGASGTLNTILPNPLFSVGGLLIGRSDAWQIAYEQGAEARLVVPTQRDTGVIGANGQQLAEITVDSDAFIVSELSLPDTPPMPDDTVPQPAMYTSDSARDVINVLSNGLLTLTYRRGVRRQWGARMAHMSDSTRLWLKALLSVSLIAFVLGWFFGRRD